MAAKCCRTWHTPPRRRAASPGQGPAPSPAGLRCVCDCPLAQLARPPGSGPTVRPKSAPDWPRRGAREKCTGVSPPLPGAPARLAAEAQPDPLPAAVAACSAWNSPAKRSWAGPRWAARCSSGAGGLGIAGPSAPRTRSPPPLPPPQHPQPAASPLYSRSADRQPASGHATCSVAIGVGASSGAALLGACCPPSASPVPPADAIPHRSSAAAAGQICPPDAPRRRRWGDALPHRPPGGCSRLPCREIQQQNARRCAAGWAAAPPQQQAPPRSPAADRPPARS